MVFEGRFGPLVEGLPESFRNISEEENETLILKYEEDPVFRETIGPNIELWSENGSCSSLNNLQIDIDLGSFGNVRGICICKCVEESEEVIYSYY